MRTFRAMSLTALVLLAITSIATYHISHWLVNDQNSQGELYAIMLTFGGLGIAVSTLLVWHELNNEQFGTSEFMRHLAGRWSVWFGVSSGCVAFCAMLAGFGSSSVNNPKPYNGLLFLTVVVSWMGGLIISLLTQVLVNGKDTWTDQFANIERDGVTQLRRGA